MPEYYDDRDLFLDSGAFSAFQKGEVIDIEAYMDYIDEHRDILDIYANLDVIGDPKATLVNQQLMESYGFTPLPCYHFGEDIKWLEHYIANYDFIALGGLVVTGRGDVSKWLDHIFDKYLTDSDGMPIIKVHGFGVTNHKMLFRYPWYSVDSTSWTMTGATGGIVLPALTKGKADFTKNLMKIDVSKDSKNKADKKHFDNLTDKQKDHVRMFCAEYGISVGSIRNKFEWRAAFNICVFNALMNYFTYPKPFKVKTTRKLFV